MSVWADRAVRLVAHTLPAPIRTRHREEWRADVAAADSVGLKPGSVALGAAVFSLTLDRDLPAVSGFPVPIKSQRHARWALLLTGLAAVFGLGRVLLADLGIDAIPIAVALVLAALVNLWAAARLSSGLARTSATLGTAGMVILVAGSTIPVVISDAVPGSRLLPLLAAALLAGALILGLAVWMTGVHPLGVGLLSVAVVLGVVSLTLFPVIGPFVLAASVVIVGLLWQLRHPSPASAGSTRVAAAVTSVSLLVLIALGALDTLVVTPLWMAGRGLSLEAVYSRLPDGAAAIGIGDVVVWVVAALVVVTGLLALAVRFAHRVGVRHTVLIAVGLGALVLLTAPYAGGYLWQQLLESLYGARFDMPGLRRGLYLVGLALLAVAAFGWIGPRRPREAVATA